VSFGAPKNLVVLTADKDAKFAIESLIRRHADLGIRPIEADVVEHYLHDGAVLTKAHDFLRSYLKWDFSLVVFDREGCGRERETREAIEQAVEDRLSRNGWDGRCRAVVMDPELESWVWDSTFQVHRILNWPGGAAGLQQWVEARGFASAGGKPQRPKEALREALKYREMKSTSAHFARLAQSFRFQQCHDPAFRKFLATLQGWFPL
jgi:hypothetical protein